MALLMFSIIYMISVMIIHITECAWSEYEHFWSVIPPKLRSTPPYNSVVFWVNKPDDVANPSCGGNIIYHDMKYKRIVVLTAGHCCGDPDHKKGRYKKRLKDDLHLFIAPTFKSPFEVFKTLEHTEAPKEIIPHDFFRLKKYGISTPSLLPGAILDWDTGHFPKKVAKKSKTISVRYEDFCVAVLSTGRFDAQFSGLVTPMAIDPAWITEHKHRREAVVGISDIQIVGFWPDLGDKQFGEEVHTINMCGWLINKANEKHLIKYRYTTNAEAEQPQNCVTLNSKQEVVKVPTTGGVSGSPIFKHIGQDPEHGWFQVGIHVEDGKGIIFDKLVFNRITKVIHTLSLKLATAEPAPLLTELGPKQFSDEITIIHANTADYGDDIYEREDVGNGYNSYSSQTVSYDSYFPLIWSYDILMFVLILFISCIACFVFGGIAGAVFVKIIPNSRVDKVEDQQE